MNTKKSTLTRKQFLASSVALAAMPSVFADTKRVVKAGGFADTVVYGTIRTAETGSPVAEAFAVRDGNRPSRGSARRRWPTARGHAACAG